MTEQRCPRCGSRDVALFVYGEPVWSPAVKRAMETGEVFLAGCIVEDNDPDHECRDCGKRF